MANRVEIKHRDGHIEIHFEGVSGSDYTLCGHDMDGDHDWKRATETTKKVNCRQCIEIVEHCKTIKRNEHT